MAKELIIDDLVILGQSSPDRLSDGRISVCTAGYSPIHGFIRLYPTRIDSKLRMWSVVLATVERNPKNSRLESWKIKGSRIEWYSLDDIAKVKRILLPKERLSFVSPHVDGCIHDIREEGRSLGIIKPVKKECYLSERLEFNPYDQLTLDGSKVLKDKNRFPFQPRVKFMCGSCKSENGHDQQILEWGIYEWMRKNPGKEEKVWKNLFAHESRQKIFFLVGNMAFHPASFIVISILRIRHA